MADAGLEKTALSPFVVIYRGLSTNDVLSATDALAHAGFDCFEVSLTTPNAIESIRALQKRFGDRAMIGAGTVRTLVDLEAVREAGARLVLSPETFEPVISRARQYGMHVVPGAYTATEVGSAHRFGAHTVKIFPAGANGVDYFRLLREPMPEIPLLVTGGVTAEAARAYFDAGAVSVGVGAKLLGGSALETRDWNALAEGAVRYRTTALGTTATDETREEVHA